jgi:acyl-[acyl carrier protein]--UDP-N-acetylglucosamine O-acyltransferase
MSRKTKSTNKSKVAPQSEIEAQVEIEQQSEIEAQVEIEQQSEIEAQVEIEPQSEIEAQVEIEPQSEIEAQVEIEPQVEIESQVEIEPQVEIEAQVEIEPQVEIESQVEIEPQVEIESQVEIEPQSEIESQVEIEPQSEIDAQVEIEPQSEIEAQVEIEPQSEIDTKVDNNVICKCNIILVSPIESDINIDMSEETYKDLVMFCESKNITVPTSPLLMSIWRKELKEAQDAQIFTDETFNMARNYNIAAGYKIYAESIEEAIIPKEKTVPTKNKKHNTEISSAGEIKINTSENTNVLLCIMKLSYYNKYFVKIDASEKAHFAKVIPSHRHTINNIDNTISYYQKMYAPKGKEKEIVSLIKDTICNDARAMSKTEWLYEPPVIAESESQLSLEIA